MINQNGKNQTKRKIGREDKHKLGGLTTNGHFKVYLIEIDLYWRIVLVIACSTGSLSILDAP